MIDVEKDIRLENNRVLLRPLQAEDSEHLMPFAMKEPDLWTYSLVQGGGRENMLNYIKLAIEGRENASVYPFIIFDKQTDSYAGSTRFYDIQNHHLTTQLGFTWLGKDFQGTGLNRHMKWLMLDYAFREAGLERVEFRADMNNARSIAAMKGIGCVEEGVLRSNCTSPTGRRSSIVLSILKKEWESHVGESLKAILS
jgi:RimJ/RimL family protein N-acetyltransferase